MLDGNLFCLNFFPVNNGVRQGGIMSPLLFNLYVNDLSVQLQKLPVGCCCGDMVVNHLMYADDIVLLAPSGKGMQTIIYTTYAYEYNEITGNVL